jgi:CRP-like cAMP-binding protein
VRIRGLEFFKKFRNSDLAELLSWAQWMPVKAGETVIEEGELGLPFYVIVSGRLAAIKNSHVLTLLHAGESFGELAYLDDENPQRGASVVAKTDCELLMLEPIHLESAELMLRMHIAEALVRIQAKRLRRAMNVVAKVLENKKQGNHNETN